MSIPGAITISGPFPIIMDAPGDTDPRRKQPEQRDRRVRLPARKAGKR